MKKFSIKDAYKALDNLAQQVMYNKRLINKMWWEKWYIYIIDKHIEKLNAVTQKSVLIYQTLK